MLNLAFKQVAVWSLVLVLFGCASHGGAENQRTLTRSAAILGVTIVPGVEPGRSRSAMTQELEELMQTEAGYALLRSANVKRAVDKVAPTAFESMLNNYARTGALNGNDLNALQKANLPVKTVLIARVEKNAVRSSPPQRIAIRNNRGDVLSDRERIVLSTMREMQIRASMVDVVSGRVIWSKSYRATPEVKSSYVHYSGSSFSGSLAASFANTMTNGLRVPAGPVPPSNLLTVRSVLQEIVRNLPKRIVW